MTPWLETIGVLALAMSGVALGRWFGRLPAPFWLIGYFVPLLLAGLIGAGRHHAAWEMVPPISWLMAGRTEYALIAIIVTMLLTTPMAKISNPRLRLLVSVFMALIVSLTSAWPFLSPAFNRGYLASLETHVDGDGVCRQSNEYNCGPAAAVTALRRLGYPAEEGEIAIMAHTSQAIGTPPDLLCRALQNHYGSQELKCEYRSFSAVSELNQGGITLAVIKFGIWVDHYVAVLRVADNEVIVGDPLTGKTTYSVEEFQRKWRFIGVVLQRGAGRGK